MNTQQLFFNYGAVILEFLFELGIFYALFCAKLSRRSRFVPRLVLGVALLLVLALAAAAFYTLYGETIPGRVLVYMFLFALVFLLGLFLFDESAWTVLFCASGAYAVQNLVYKLYLLQYYLGKLLGIYRFGGDPLGRLFYRLMYYGVFALLAAAAYHLVIRRMRHKLAVAQMNYKVFAIALFTLAVSVVLCSVEDILFERAGMGVGIAWVHPPLLFSLRQTGNALSAVCGGVILLAFSKTLEQHDLQREVAQLQYAIRQGEQQYKISKDTVDMINIKCHDMKYKLDAAILGSGVSADAFADLRRSIRIYDCSIDTGNTLLNVLFYEKSLYCESQGITLSCMIDGGRLSFMEDGDLYCLFGNIVDNALEAVTKLEQRERRVISVEVKAREGMALVQAENYYTGDLVQEDGLLATGKADKDYHGFGLKSIRAITGKYGGEMAIDIDGDVFRLTLLFPGGQG